jgi:mRNA interferase YafQ
MRTISQTKKFRKDLKREMKGVHRKSLEKCLSELVNMLIADIDLPLRYKDHALVGEWSDCRDVHVFPDLVLIYRKVGKNSLELVRIGSHSELSL